MASYKQIISRFSKSNILVIGDIMLDRYIQGRVSRISPEAPVPIVCQEKSFHTPGGASNVAHNLSSLKAKVTQIGRIGNDFEGQILKRELKRKGIDVSGVFVDKNLPTITKTRVIAEHQQVVRIDRESLTDAADKQTDLKIRKFIEKNIKFYDGIILSDYGKGLITAELVNFVRDLALKNKKVITVDPKVEHFGYYRNVTCITPNRKEAENAIRNLKIREDAVKLGIKDDRLRTDEDINRAGKKLLEYLKLESILITLGEQGMRLFEKGQKPVTISTQAREVFDVTGAGDTVISVFTLSLTAGATKKQAAHLANHAAGVVVGKMGAVAITSDEILSALKGK